MSNATVRNAIFQVHWLLGITAGLVLALVGATGAMLSFEDAILERVNPGVLQVAPRGDRLPPATLLARVRAARPEDTVSSLTLAADPRAVARVAFAPGNGATGRGERRALDPYTGEVLPHPRGEAFFRTTMRVHRWLAADDVGKQVVGASTVALVFFCLSGLYLRWPRRVADLRGWLALDWRLKGRAFLWRLHAVVGTWVLLAYLVMALSGLWWSYGWYRTALEDWAGRPTRDTAAPGTMSGPDAAATGRDVDVAGAWRAFEAAAPPWSEATLALGPGTGPIDIRYMDARPEHERARNTLSLDRGTLAVLQHDRYADRALPERVVGGIFALHRGSWFGPAGTWLFMLASALMPVFAISGWLLYLDRRRRPRGRPRPG